VTTVYDPPTLEVTEAPAAAEEARPSGPAAAVVLAAGLGCFMLGLLTVLTVASSTFSDAMTFSERVGDLAGVTTIATIVFFAAWIGLALVWRTDNPPLSRIAGAAGLLVALGLLGTFPPFFNLFG
jgi:hypothetical protein